MSCSLTLRVGHLRTRLTKSSYISNWRRHNHGTRRVSNECSPAHALVVASSEDHKPGMLKTKEEFHVTEAPTVDPDVRADLTFFETAAGGAVFSTGSISFAGALSTNGYDNDIATLMGNVLTRFINPEPFVFPTFRVPPDR